MTIVTGLNGACFMPDGAISRFSMKVTQAPISGGSGSTAGGAAATLYIFVHQVTAWESDIPPAETDRILANEVDRWLAYFRLARSAVRPTTAGA